MAQVRFLFRSLLLIEPILGTVRLVVLWGVRCERQWIHALKVLPRNHGAFRRWGGWMGVSNTCMVERYIFIVLSEFDDISLCRTIFPDGTGSNSNENDNTLPDSNSSRSKAKQACLSPESGACTKTTQTLRCHTEDQWALWTSSAYTHFTGTFLVFFMLCLGPNLFLFDYPNYS